MAAAPKKRPAKGEKDDKSEPVKPQTVQEKVQASMQELLQSAAGCRTKSLTLGGLKYAEDLASELLAHATKLEGLYSTIRDGIKSKSATEKDFKQFLAKIEEVNTKGEKMKASKQL